MATLTIEISDDLKAYIDRIASEQGSSPEDLIRKYFAGRRYVESLEKNHETREAKARALGYHCEQDILDAIS